jgi:hypothetical protein
LPSVNALQEELKDRGLTVLLVNLWEKPDRVAKEAKARKYTARVLLDPEGKVSRNGPYRVFATPTVYLVGRDGTLLGQAIGPKPWAEPEGRALLDALLKGSGPRAQ